MKTPIKITVKPSVATESKEYIEKMSLPKHKKEKTALLGFAMNNRSEENICFMFDICDIEKELNDARELTLINKEIIEKYDEFQTKFKLIYDKYVPITAIYQINISDELRKNLEQENSHYKQSNDNNSTSNSKRTFFTLKNFKAAYEEIEINIAPSILALFHQSDFFKKLQAEPLTQRDKIVSPIQKHLIPSPKPHLYSSGNNFNDQILINFRRKSQAEASTNTKNPSDNSTNTNTPANTSRDQQLTTISSAKEYLNVLLKTLNTYLLTIKDYE